MSRPLVALFDSRAEAEDARARLISQVGARSPRIIAKDTAAAVDTLDLEPRDAKAYREAIQGGAHLLVAEVPSGTKPGRIVELLEAPAGANMQEREEPGSRERSAGDTAEPQRAADADKARSSDLDAPSPTVREEAAMARARDAARGQAPRHAGTTGERRKADRRDELANVRQEQPRGGARVRSFTHEAAAEEQVALRTEAVEVENRPSERRLTDTEVEAGGLFKERVIEIAEMREEAVVTKEAVVREEVIVRKRVRERTETVRDTVRRTEVEVEDLPPSDR